MCLSCAGDDAEPELFFDQAEVLSGADAGARAAMLDHLDGLLVEPDSDQVEEVRGPAYADMLHSSDQNQEQSPITLCAPPTLQKGSKAGAGHCPSLGAHRLFSILGVSLHAQSRTLPFLFAAAAPDPCQLAGCRHCCIHDSLSAPRHWVPSYLGQHRE